MKIEQLNYLISEQENQDTSYRSEEARVRASGYLQALYDVARILDEIPERQDRIITRYIVQPPKLAPVEMTEAQRLKLDLIN